MQFLPISRWLLTVMLLCAALVHASVGAMPLKAAGDMAGATAATCSADTAATPCSELPPADGDASAYDDVLDAEEHALIGMQGGEPAGLVSPFAGRDRAGARCCVLQRLDRPPRA